MLKKIMVFLVCLLLIGAVALGFLVHVGRLSSYHPLQKPKDEQIRVACVGDSVTYGFDIPNRNKWNYPARLQAMLGDGYCVNNYGYSGRTVSDEGDRPYRKEALFQKVLAFQPQIVVLMLGSNDSKPFNWNAQTVRESYVSLVKELQDLDSAPQIYLVTPTPVFPVNGSVKYQIDGSIIDDTLVPMVLGIGAQLGLPVIDMHSVFSDREDLFPDGCHPNRAGAQLFAETVYAAMES